MPEQVGDIVEQLRRLSWEIRISRDQLLKTAEGLPPSLLQRAQQTTEKLMSLHREIQEISGKLPADAGIACPRASAISWPACAATACSPCGSSMASLRICTTSSRRRRS